MSRLTLCVAVLLLSWTRSTSTASLPSSNMFADNSAEFIQWKVDLVKKHLHHAQWPGSVDGWRLGSPELCFLCKVLAGTIYDMLQEQQHEDVIVRVITDICIQADIEDERVCRYIVQQYKDMAFITIEQVAVTPDQLCGLVLGPPCSTPYLPTEMWNITLTDVPKPPVKPHRLPQPSSPKIRFLQLTDIHIDVMYEVGSNAQCGEPLCCRSNDGPPDPGVPGAGRWGDLRVCDLSLDLTRNLFEHLNSIHNQFDYVIFTGDISAHDVWNQTRQEQIQALERLVSYFREYLPFKPVYFTAGNHDSAPCNSFPPPFIKGNNSQEWMYAAMAANWGRWLPPETQSTIMRAGFYSFSPYPGFRIISLNNMFCYNLNWWVFINTTDPAGELQWLVQQLQQAEDTGEKVHILQHIPTDCLKAWSWNFYRIVTRYESTIVGQFNGHTHKDEFRVYYDVHNLTRPVNVAYVGGSVTSKSGLNPNFRIYTMDGFYANSSFAVLDYTDYIFNITKNNNLTDPKWEEEYSPLSEYGMTSAFPDDWNQLIYRMRDDNNLFNTFHRHRSKGADVSTCDHRCKTLQLCQLKSGRSDDPELCRGL